MTMLRKKTKTEWKIFCFPYLQKTVSVCRVIDLKRQPGQIEQCHWFKHLNATHSPLGLGEKIKFHPKHRITGSAQLMSLNLVESKCIANVKDCNAGILMHTYTHSEEICYDDLFIAACVMCDVCCAPCVWGRLSGPGGHLQPGNIPGLASTKLMFG